MPPKNLKVGLFLALSATQLTHKWNRLPQLLGGAHYSVFPFV